MNGSRNRILVICLLSVLAIGLHAGERQVLRGHLPAAAARLQPVGRLPGTNRLELAIGLPLRNRDGLTNLLRQLYDPASASFRQYLTPDQFTEAFGPTEPEYQAVIAFAKANGLTVTGTHGNRMLLDVAGAAADLEKAFQVKFSVYQHPQEARTFFAPEAEPSVTKGLRVLHISGLDNYTLPRPRSHRRVPGPAAGPIARNGSAPGGSGAYFGKDFRNAYVPGLALTGTGQTVGLFEFDGYYASDITKYATQAGFTKVPLTNLFSVLIDGFNGVPDGRIAGSGNEEVALDIEMTISMAPGLSRVLVYEASPQATAANVDDMLNRMATDNLAKQLSCSWGTDLDTTSQQIFQQFAAQGQSFFVASGDNGAFGSFVDQPADDPYLTVVGGTTLTTGTAHNWVAETAWSGSGGGISSIYPLPDWQQGINMSANHGSTTMRNVPDVAMVADNAWDMADEGSSFPVMGTSIATPLWAAFTALVNQQAANNGKPPVGFLNPALYAIGKGASYSQCFHDITTGDNTSTNNPDLFFAVSGYDLCTGWGTLNGGTSLMDALLAPPTEPLVIKPPLGFYAQGRIGGPFSVTNQTYTLTNAGSASLNWSLSNTSAWLQVSPSSGTLAPGGPASTVSVALNAAAKNLLIVSYAGTVSFKNLNDGVAQDRQFTLRVGNGGFETGDFTDWSFSGDTNANFIDTIDTTDLNGGYNTLQGVDDSLFVHSGSYGAWLGQSNSLGSISQVLPTTAGQQYLLSFWLDNPAVGTPNQFIASWNGTDLFKGTSLGAFPWTNLQYTVSATGASTPLKFAFRNDQSAFGLDDITVQPLSVPVPAFKAVTQANGMIALTWTTVPGLAYQVQYTGELGTTGWNNLGSPLTATSSTLSVSYSATAAPQRFYRILVP
ncbi:MAG TPA: protease pro-enzyme activation domain-containing protein [Dongiaceae bacterium]|nr:protease pro-enzyme activation domain-containing protein [Dongiaceae bacterium]